MGELRKLGGSAIFPIKWFLFPKKLLKLKQHIHYKEGHAINLCELLHQKIPGCFSGGMFSSCPLQVD